MRRVALHQGCQGQMVELLMLVVKVVSHPQVHQVGLLPQRHSGSNLRLGDTLVHPSLGFLAHTLFPWLQSGLLFFLKMRLHVHQDLNLTPHLSFGGELYHTASTPSQKLKILNTLRIGAQLQG